jgi:micrococcal nuclease
LNKKYALILALLFAGLVISDIFLFKTITSSSTSNRETAIISRVIDGDTLKLEDGRTVRLLNINTPEHGVIGWNLSYLFLKSFENKSVTLEIIGLDKYKRSLARIYAPDYLNLELVKSGMSSKFLVQDSELAAFSDAEESAIENSMGIWKKSSLYSCFSSDIDKYNEIISLKNKCDPTKVNGWTIKDESRKTYAFGDISLGEIRIHSLHGNDNSTDIYWNSEINIWNNDRDSLYIFDSEGNIVHYESYGY